MEHVKRSGQYLENPPTGYRNAFLLLMGGGAAVAKTTTAGAVGGTYLMRKLFTNPTSLKLLTSSSKMKPGSKQMNQMVTMLSRILLTEEEPLKESIGSQLRR